MVRKLFVLLGATLLLHTGSAEAAPCAGFTDVDAADPFCDEVTWMKNRGITLGLTATTYGPNNPVSRLQMALFMYRLGFENAFLEGGNAFNGVARLGTTDNHPMEVLVNGSPALRIEPHPISPNVLAGYTNNGLYSGVYGATIGGGGAPSDYAACPYAFGCQNSVTDHFGTIGGGVGNLVGDTDATLTNGRFATVGGGFANAATDSGTVAGGTRNSATGRTSTVGGGTGNLASGISSTVAGGFQNRATGTTSFAVGDSSWATGDGAVAIGNTARALLTGCIVFSDSSALFTGTSCGMANQFVARAKGGFYMFTGGADDATYTGAVLGPGSNAWAPGSDRAGKHEFEAVDPEEVLRKVAAMPVSTWQWKSEPGSIRHMGPMAQDFHAAFGLGPSDRRIVTIDADGVALAAIQGLNAKLEAGLSAKSLEIAELKAELAEMRTLREDVARMRAEMSSGRP